LTFADNNSERIHNTPTVWRDTHRETVVRVKSGKVLASVAIDTGLFIDFVQADNQWKAAS
jgi:hypothetical protein